MVKPTKTKWTSQEYYNKIGELEALTETKDYIIYAGLTQKSALNQETIERLLEIGRIDYIRINHLKKIEVVVTKKVYNDYTGIYEVPSKEEE